MYIYLPVYILYSCTPVCSFGVSYGLCSEFSRWRGATCIWRWVGTAVCHIWSWSHLMHHMLCCCGAGGVRSWTPCERTLSSLAGWPTLKRRLFTSVWKVSPSGTTARSGRPCRGWAVVEPLVPRWTPQVARSLCANWGEQRRPAGRDINNRM